MTASSPPRRPALVLRTAGVLAAVALLLLTMQEAAVRAAGRSEVDELVASTGLMGRSPEVAQRARYEPDPYWGRLTVARALVGEAVDPSPFTRLSSREAALGLSRVGERLELARRLAAAAADERPAVWEAPMLLGATAYLEASRSNRESLLTGRASWVAPLERAARLAPGSPEPARFLAAADLETWPVLSLGEQAAARKVLAAAFADLATFKRLVGAWFGVAASREDAFDLVPDLPASWRVVEAWAARRRDWQTYCAAAQRGDAALQAGVASRLAEIEERLAGGDPSGARTAVLGLVGVAHPDRRLASAVSRALTLCPPAPATPASARVFAPWLRWELDGFARGVSLLPETVAGRLLEGAGGLPAPERALALLAAGRLVEAEALDRHVEDLNTERWAPYLMAKARVLAERGENDGARTALALVHPAWRHLPEAHRLATLLGVEAAAPEPAVQWAPTAWRWHGDTAWLDALPAEAARSLEITVATAPDGGAVAEVAVGFTRVWRGAVVEGGMISVPLSAAESRAPLVVTVRSVAGGRVTPGGVRLESAATDDGGERAS